MRGATTPKNFRPNNEELRLARIGSDQWLFGARQNIKVLSVFRKVGHTKSEILMENIYKVTSLLFQ